VFEVARVGNVDAIGDGQERLHAEVDADHRTGALQRFRWNVVAGEQDIPALVISFDRDCLYPAAHLTMLVDPDVPYALQVQPMLAGGRVPPAAVPI
jgi:hypothetical protein